MQTITRTQLPRELTHRDSSFEMLEYSSCDFEAGLATECFRPFTAFLERLDFGVYDHAACT
ncbi:hypothetical protein CBI33_20595 [Rhodococcus erythropolis]|nr:hypothetical protein CBI33_20595 [Rhodococcus erythropolis]